MGKKEMIKFFEKIKNDPRITEFELSNKFNSKRMDSNWFSGEVVMSCVIDGRFDYFCEGSGEIRITHVSSGDYVVDKSGDSRRVKEFLINHGIKTDHQLYKAEEKGEIYFGNNNWFQDVLIDNRTGVNLMKDADISDGPLYFDLNYIDQFIKEVEDAIHS